MNNQIIIDKEGPAPLYHLVKEKVLEMIDSGVLKEDERIPTEKEIAEVNNISRGTIRMALRELTREGIIIRYPKRGSFVSSRHAAPPLTIAGISVIIGEKESEESTLSYYGKQLMFGIHEGCRETESALCFPKHVFSELERGSFTPDRAISGYLVITPLRQQLPLLKKLNDTGAPVMVAGAQVPGLNFVAVDNTRGIREAVQYLIDAGHQKIGAIFPDLNHFDRYERYTAFLSVLTDLGIRIDANWVRIVPDMDKAVLNYKKAVFDILQLKERPTALLAGDSEVCLAVKTVLDEQGVRVPQEMSLVGFDDFPVARIGSPAITTVAQPVMEIGRTAVEKLVENIRNRNGTVCRICLAPKLVVRDSVQKT